MTEIDTIYVRTINLLCRLQVENIEDDTNDECDLEHTIDIGKSITLVQIHYRHQQFDELKRIADDLNLLYK